MLLVADTHVHIYPFYDQAQALRQAVSAMHAHAGGAEHRSVLCLAERSDCNWFDELAQGDVPLEGITVAPAGTHGGALEVSFPDGASLCVLAGRQIVTSEGLEILALASKLGDVPGGSAESVAATVLGMGAVPVLSWGFGKWMFRRKPVVEGLVASSGPGTLLVGDTTMRPAGTAYPSQMRMASGKGLKTVFGSDPLPLAGEAFSVGRYCTVINGDLDEDDPAGSFRNMLQDPSVECMPAGRRHGILGCLRRVIAQKVSRRSPAGDSR